MTVEAPNKSQLVVLPTELGSFATRTSGEFDFRKVQSMILTIVLANKAGTVTFTPAIQRKLANGTWVTWWTAAAALSANGTVGYMFGRGGGGTITGATEKIESPIPSYCRFVLTVSGAGDGNEFDTYAEVDVSP
jgi:hypothetical protein